MPRRGVLPPPAGAPAGWYPDPFGQPAQRYYDGRGWTDHLAVHAPALRPAAVPHRTLPIEVALGAIAVLAASLLGARS